MQMPGHAGFAGAWRPLRLLYDIYAAFLVLEKLPLVRPKTFVCRSHCSDIRCRGILDLRSQTMECPVQATRNISFFWPRMAL